MKINDEVWEPLWEIGHEALDVQAQAVINAYLKSVWVPFDKNDETTWPDKYDSISGPMLVLIKGAPVNAYWCALNQDFSDDFTDEVTHYCNHADIVPEGEE